MRIMPSSSMMRTIFRLRMLTVSLPYCPGILRLGRVRPGVMLVPMEPPWRRYSWVPWVRTKPAKLQRRTTPVKPRPRVVPCTSTN
jgi:hypothetical protein